MNILDLIPAYTDYLTHEKGLKKATIVNYLADLRKYGQINPKPVSEITLDDLREYQRYLSKGEGWTAVSVRRCVSGFVTFWRWLKVEGRVSDVLPSMLTLPKKKKVIPRWINEQELKRFATTPDKHPDPRLAQRNNLAWMTLATLALRRGELLNLKVSDVSLADSLIIIRDTKSGDDRAMRMLPELQEAFKEWLKDICSDEYVFHTKPRTKWSKQAFMNAFTAHLRDCELEGKATPHTIRHSVASMLHKKGAGLPEIKEFLGHKDMSSTLIYIHADPGGTSASRLQGILS